MKLLLYVGPPQDKPYLVGHHLLEAGLAAQSAIHQSPDGAPQSGLQDDAGDGQALQHRTEMRTTNSHNFNIIIKTFSSTIWSKFLNIISNF